MPMFSVQHMSLFPFFFSYLYPIPPPQNPEFEWFLVVSMHIVLKKKWRKIKKCRSIFFTLFMGISRMSNILFVCNIFIWTIKCILLSGNGWKVALQIVGLKFYKNAKKSSIYSQSLLICVHKTPVVENHLTTWEIKRFTTAQVDTMGRHVLFLDDQLAHLHTGVDNHHRNLPAKKQWNPINSFREEIFQRFYFIP